MGIIESIKLADSSSTVEPASAEEIKNDNEEAASNQRMEMYQLALTKIGEELCKSIDSNSTSLIFKNYEDFVKELSNDPRYQALKTDIQKKMFVAQEYSKYTKRNLEKDLENNEHDDFISGFIQGETFGISGDRSASQLKEELLGIRRGETQELKKGLGIIVGAAASIASLGFAGVAHGIKRLFVDD